MAHRLRTTCIFATCTLAIGALLGPLFDPRGNEGALLLADQRATLADPKRDAEGHRAMRHTNPEWDLMQRMFLGLTLANAALREDGKGESVSADLDRVAHGLLADDAKSATSFLLPYGQSRPLLHGEHSIFADGEIAVVLAAREVAYGPNADHDALDARVHRIERAMDESPSRSGESYPDEAWTFCNTTALAALRLYDIARGTDHRAHATAWIAYAKAHLVDKNGMLVSSYRYDGTWKDGAEGSSVFMSAHNLLLWDEPFARDQWTRAKRALVFDVAGFTLAREWPRDADSIIDIDSGAVVPWLDASAGASGLAVLGASAFGDKDATRGLMRSLRFAAFPRTTSQGMHFAAANPMGDAVVSYALSFGPLWARAAHPGKVALR